MFTAHLFLYFVEGGTVSFTKPVSSEDVLGTRNRSDPEASAIVA